MKIIVLSFIFFIIVGCGYNPPKDEKGHKPKDAVKIFISLVKDNRYDEAEKMWYGKSKRISTTIPFEKFCSKFKNIDFTKCNFYTCSGKSGFTMVYIDWLENGKEKHYFFGLKIIDGEWKMERGHDF